ncbi:MAG: hypothetical protein AB7K24_03030 [Gemmataceae bacterium]
MAITFQCPQCSQTHTLPDSAGGQQTRCGECACDMTVPAATAISVYKLPPTPAPVDIPVLELATPPTPRYSPKPVLLGAALTMLLLVCVVVIGVWYLFGSKASVLVRFLPDNTQLVVSLRTREVQASAAWQKFKEAAPDLIRQLDRVDTESGSNFLPEEDVEELLIGGSVRDFADGRPVLAFKCSKHVTAEEVLARLGVKEHEQATVGGVSLYEYTAAAPVRRGGKPQVLAVCVPEPNILLGGKTSSVRAILERAGQPPEWSDELRSAMAEADFSAPLLLVADIKGIRGQLGAREEARFLEGVDGARFQFNLGESIRARCQLFCSDDKKAEDLRDLIAGAVAMVKLAEHTPRELRELLATVKIERHARDLSCQVNVDTGQLAALVRAKQEQLLARAKVDAPRPQFHRVGDRLVVQPAPVQPKPEVPKPENPLRVPPPPPALRIVPAPLQGEKLTVALPDTRGEIVVGGGGRFLIVHLPKLRQLAILDVNEARIVKYLPVAEDLVHFAAGMDKLLIYLPTASVLQRWSLATLERETTVAMPLSKPPNLLLMGSASAGPLVCGMERSLAFIDVQSLKVLEPTQRNWGSLHFDPKWHPMTARISADGHVLGAWCPSLGPSGLNSMAIIGSTIKFYSEHTQVGHIHPGPDGRMLFTGAGLYTSELKKIGTERRLMIPAVHGHYYLSMNPYDFVRLGARRDNKKVALSVHLVGDTRPLLTLEDLEGLPATERNDLGGLPVSLDKRIFLIPRAELLVLIPDRADQLVLHHLNLDEALEKSAIDYLVVTSPPNTLAVRGQTYQYNVAIKSKKGDVKCKLEAGPDGMKASPDGRLTWAVPRKFSEEMVEVILAVRDASGQEIFHAFRIKVED